MGLIMKSKFIPALASVLLALTLASCEDIFQTKIPRPGENDSLDNLFRSVSDIIKLDTPDQFYVAPYYSSKEIRLTWSAVPGAAYYMVERAVVEPSGGTWEKPDEGAYEPLDRFVYPTSYSDQILKTSSLDSPEYNNRYYYRVSAFNTEKKFDESDPTEPQYAMLFRAPAGVRASGGTETDFVEVYWDEAPGAVSYEILRSTLSNGQSYSILGTIQNVLNNGKIRYKNNVSPAEQGVDFYYMVRAVNSFGNSTLITRPAYGYARMFGAPDAPKNVKLAVNSGRGHSLTEIKIEWDPVAEGDAYYAVYRYNENDSSLTRLTDKTPVTNLSDKNGLKPGIFYYYKVQAILDDPSNGKQLKSQFSSNDPEGYVLSCPDELVAEKSGSNIVIKWRPAKSSEAERSQFTYNVYADSSLNGNFNAIAMAGVPTYVEADGYISTEVSSYTYGGQFFKVASLKGGLTSEKSSAVSPSPSAAVILDASQRAFIDLNERANANGVYAVKVTWKKPDDDEPAFYHVQRSTSSESGYSRITTAPLSANGPIGGDNSFTYDPATGVYTYLDRNESARVYRKYYYRVLSLNQLEQGSFQSGWKIGWGALSHEQYLIEYIKTVNNALYKNLTLMNKAGATDKLGSETKYGAVSGDIYYNAALSGLGAKITIRMTNYADFSIENVRENGPTFVLNGTINTNANMSSNGDQNAVMTVTGASMYPGMVYHDLEIKGGDAGGGTYGVQPEGGFPRVNVNWKVAH